MVIPSFYPQVGGAERQLESLAVHLARMDVTIIVYTRRLPGTLRSETLDDYLVNRLPARIPKIGFGLALLARLLWRRDDHDILHCHTLSAQTALACLIAGWLTRKPVILKVTRSGHGTQLSTYRRGVIGRWLFAFMASRATRFIAITNDVSHELRAARVAQDKIVELPNGVELPPSTPRAGDMPLKIVYVGRLITRKRVDFLIKVLYGLGKPQDAHLLIAGDGKEQASLKGLARQLGLEASVSFLGEISAAKVKDLLQQADIFVLPSESEGMSNALLEAMAHGLPVIATDIPANQALISSGENGLLFDGQEGLRAALEQLSLSADLRTRLGQSARARVEADFSFESVARGYKALYQKTRNEF